MTTTNRELLQRAGAVLGDMGVRDVTNKAAMTSENMASGEFMDRKQVRRLVDLTVGQSDWLAAATVELKDQRSGEHPIMELSGPVMEGVPENGGRTITTTPTMDNFEWDCGKFQATWYWTRESVREAVASGEPDFDGKVRAAFARRMGNDVALAAVRGDTDLDDGSRENRLLRKRDGWLKRLRATANRSTTTYGSSYDPDVWDATFDLLPEVYQRDPDLRWLYASKIAQSHTKGLRDLGDGAVLRDQALTERREWAPNGIAGLIVPQLPTDDGFDTLDGASVDPDTVVDDTDGTMTVTVNTLFGGYSTSNAGRRVRITCDATGQSETLTVVNSGGANKIMSTGSLGQGTISETEADYTIDVADCTSIVLTNPRNLVLVVCDKVRAYMKFEQEWERWRIDVFMELDFRVVNPDAAAMHDGVVPTRFTFGA